MDGDRPARTEGALQSDVETAFSHGARSANRRSIGAPVTVGATAARGGRPARRLSSLTFGVICGLQGRVVCISLIKRRWAKPLPLARSARLADITPASVGIPACVIR